MQENINVVQNDRILNFNVRRYIHYLIDGSWENIFDNLSVVKEVAPDILLSSYADDEHTHYFDWIKRVTILFISLSGSKLEDIFTDEEYRQIRDWLNQNYLTVIQSDNYHDAIYLIKHLNDICRDYKNNSEDVLKKFTILLKPKNDNLLSICISLLVERIVGLNFYGINTSDHKMIVLTPAAEYFLNRMTYDVSAWLKIMNKIKGYFEKFKKINLVRAFTEKASV